MCHRVGRDKQAQQGVGASQPLGFQGRGEQHLGKPEEVWTKREEIPKAVISGGGKQTLPREMRGGSQNPRVTFWGVGPL